MTTYSFVSACNHYNYSHQANPKNRKEYKIKNPLELFKFNSVHGGLWRAAYTVDSIGEVSVLIHFLGGPQAFLPVVGLIVSLTVFAVIFFTSPN